MSSTRPERLTSDERIARLRAWGQERRTGAAGATPRSTFERQPAPSRPAARTRPKQPSPFGSSISPSTGIAAAASAPLPSAAHAPSPPPSASPKAVAAPAAAPAANSKPAAAAAARPAAASPTGAGEAGEGAVDVMLSINVRSMAASAGKLKALLQASGYSVWVCTDAIAGGAEYRDAIVSAVKRCRVFLPLINDAWASSGECKDEYSFAKRLNLTSHERGLTTPPEPRRPVMLPVSFPDLDWGAYPHVELLAASTNFIVHDGADLAGGSAEQTFAQILEALAAAVRPPTGKGAKLRRSGSTASAGPAPARAPGEGGKEGGGGGGAGAAGAALARLAEQMQGAMSSLQALQRAGPAALGAGRAAGAGGAGAPGAPAEPPEDKRYYESKLLKRAPERYLGISRFLVNGCYATSAMELVLSKVSEDDAEVKVKGHMHWRKLRCEIVEHDNPRAEPFFLEFSAAAEEQLCERLAPLEEPITGAFIKRNGLLCLQGLGPANARGERWIYEYRLPISDNGSVLSGVTKGDRGTPPDKQWMNPFRAVAF
eukprot:tig00000857_g4935.t1